jgi:folate-binding protein YgfZ
MTTTPRFAEIEVVGPDARSFLHSQLANDVRAIEPEQWRFGSYCAADGRVQALLMVACESAEHWRLLLPADLTAAVTDRLQRYRLRARCTIATTEVAIDASRGASTGPVGSYACDAYTWHCAGGSSAPLPLQLWTQQLQLGIPWIVAATSERFLPQMLALERLQAYSLRKGCFPGQEIVARTHYLGRSKRRLVRLTAVEGGAEPGAELCPMDSDTGIGVLIAAGASSECDGLAVVAESAAAGTRVRVAGSARNAAFVIESDVIETIGDARLNGRYHPPFSAWHSAG